MLEALKKSVIFDKIKNEEIKNACKDNINLWQKQ